MQNQEQQEVENEEQVKEKELLRIVKKQTLGDRDHVKVIFDNERGRFLITPEDYSLRTSTAFRKEFSRHFSQPPKWDSEQKAFSVPVAELPNVGEAVKTARKLSAELQQVRTTWLEDIKAQLWKAVNEHEREGFDTRLKEALAYRTEHPEEVAHLPPLPNAYVEPVIKDVYANTRDGAWSNGQIVAFNKHFVAQYTGRGKLLEDQISKSPEHYITLHSTDKFLHTAENWNNPTQAVRNSLGACDNGEWKSIEYNHYSKALVFDYDPNIHSKEARLQHNQDLSTAQVAKEKEQVKVVAQIPAPEEKKKAPVRKKRQAQAMSM